MVDPFQSIARFCSRPLVGAARWVQKIVIWLAPLVWEELGRLGLATRRILKIIGWPLLTPLSLVFHRMLRPLLAPALLWLGHRTFNLIGIIRQQWQIRSAKRLWKPQKTWAISSKRPLILALSLSLTANLLLILLLWQSHPVQTTIPASASIEQDQPTEVFITSSTLLSPLTFLPTPIPITPAPTPDHLAAGGSVAYTVRMNGNDDLYALSVGREKAVRLTFHPSDDRDPAWAPDGRRLAFSTHRNGNWDLFVMDIASDASVRLTQNVAYDGKPSWSPDGKWLAFESYRNQNLDIYLLPISGGTPRQLTSHPEADYAPVWSPSGRHILFISRRNGNPDLYQISLDDARDEAAINISRTPDMDENHPSWHPGGEYIAFSSKSGGREIVYAQSMLNQLPSGEPIPIGQGSFPTWSPNGDAVLYVHNEGTERHYLLAGSATGWGVAPEVYLAHSTISSPDWSAFSLPTLWSFGESASTTDWPLFLEAVAVPETEGPPYTLVTLDALAIPGPFLSDRVDDSFDALRQRVRMETGWDVLENLSKMWEPMDELPPPGIDKHSWNKAGRAFDLNSELNSGIAPAIEVVPEIVACDQNLPECTGTALYWRLYAKTVRQDGSQGEPLRVLPWDFSARYSGNTSDYEAGGRIKSEIPSGYYVDLTRLITDYEWERVPAGRTWRTHYPAILFWHFEKRQELEWQVAMRELYTDKELVEIFGDLDR